MMKKRAANVTAKAANKIKIPGEVTHACFIIIPFDASLSYKKKIMINSNKMIMN